ncbi:tumor necrosis factor receptor superfamily member 17 isoform X1 [Herpailurus yagouaroundi]|uniref:tumor necrosis factor receptor superfamily member 17 isoform X1 n=1 Tax=Herpailurus yagouaroundi TaxID=1608482 RepID=UPI001AD76B64|nr:tumor necrosis factor receptor superfamily member 17 isoform X1 [Puma yagouaroundi]
MGCHPSKCSKSETSRGCCVPDRKHMRVQALFQVEEEMKPSGVWGRSVKGTNTILWTCLGLSLTVSLTVFVLMFLLRKMSSEPSKDAFKNTGSALRNEAEADQRESRESRTGAKVLFSRGLEYTVEECTCEDCVKNKSTVDSDHSFPLPAMEEGATILVTTKTNDYCNSLVASVTEMERSIFTR